MRNNNGFFSAAISIFLLFTLTSGSEAQERTLERSEIAQLQKMLDDLNFRPGAADGLFGSRSQAALSRFAQRFSYPEAAEPTRDAFGRVELVHRSWFGEPDRSRSSPQTGLRTVGRMVLQTDVRESIADCAECRVTHIVLAAADFNGDGSDELLIGQYLQDRQYRHVNRPAPLLLVDVAERLNANLNDPASRPTYPADELASRVHPREAVVADFNNDGKLDVFVAAAGLDAQPFPGERNLLLLNDDSGLRDRSTTHLPDIVDMAHGATAVDLNGDGAQDIFVMTNEGRTRVRPYALINDGSGRFSMMPGERFISRSLIDEYDRGRRHEAQYSTARFADLNADGDLDLILLSRGERHPAGSFSRGFRHSLVIYGDGSGFWSEARAIELPTDRWGARTFSTDAAIADLTGDGTLDLLISQNTRNNRWFGNFLQLFSQEGGRWVDRTAEHLWPQGYPENEALNFPNSLRLADLNADGHDDLVVQSLSPAWRHSPDDSAVVVAMADGEKRFVAPFLYWISREYAARELIPVTVRNGDQTLTGLAGYRLNGNHRPPVDHTYGMLLELYLPNSSPR